MQAPPPRTPAPSAPPQQPVTANQGRPDCSSYPMMIAQARSETEMRAVAQMYLTCLLKSGWNMEQARSHVITTIESTYRLARQTPAPYLKSCPVLPVHLAGRFNANCFALINHFFKSSSDSNPLSSTIIQPFIARPVISKGLA